MAHLDTQETVQSTRRFIKKAMQLPMLELEHERHLARQWKDHADEKALHELTGAHMRLVISLASKFRNYGLPMADLIQEGNIGLMQAANRFDIDREVRFSTYAGWWIRSSIQDYVLRNWSIVRTGTTAAQKSLFFNMRRLRAKINDIGNTMTHESRNYVARELGVRMEDVEKMEGRMEGNDRSLNATIADKTGDGSVTEWQDLLVCDRDLPDEEVGDKLDGSRRKNWISEALSGLNPRELTIIRSRRLTEETVTLECLGNELGISKERVRQIEHEALGKLKNILIEKTNGDPEQAGLI
ncbi:RNA polymerase factor sigma-32 [Alphaproteobacteria bacterium]|nr:RNA polymerase factor sigma-32 [Alphaproteobacteria bacterium]MDC0131787.1 RNA polymerase factor sigma-32 [Alphaproteobacteria bacterium]